MPDSVVLPPQAARTIEGLRDTGYEPADALEDIVDNSIAADATEVVIRVWMTPTGEPLVTVADNGDGMEEADLINAMTYGSAARPNPASLGKFGLGLKTASTAMCRQFTVVTRGKTAAYHMRQHGILMLSRNVTSGCFSGQILNPSSLNSSMKLPKEVQAQL